MLEEIGLAFIEINQDCLHEGCFGKNFSSPTLLVDNDIVIFGGKTDSSEGACSTNLPDKEAVKRYRLWQNNGLLEPSPTLA